MVEFTAAERSIIRLYNVSRMSPHYRTASDDEFLYNETRRRSSIVGSSRPSQPPPQARDLPDNSITIIVKKDGDTLTYTRRF